MDYNKNLQYRRHHQLTTKGLDIGTIPFNMGVSLVIVVIMIFLDIEYFNILKAFDFGMFISISLYQLVLKPKIYRGEIKAYYRRDYQKLNGLITKYTFIAGTSQTRFILFGAYTFFIERNLRGVFVNSFHYIATPVSILISLLFLYITFYQDKYSTIREYSNKVNYNIKSRGMDERTAILAFKTEKDEDFNIKEFRGMYYDHPEEEREENHEIEKEEELPIRRNPRLGKKVGVSNDMDRRTQK